MSLIGAGTVRSLSKGMRGQWSNEWLRHAANEYAPPLPPLYTLAYASLHLGATLGVHVFCLTDARTVHDGTVYTAQNVELTQGSNRFSARPFSLRQRSSKGCSKFATLSFFLVFRKNRRNVGFRSPPISFRRHLLLFCWFSREKPSSFCHESWIVIVLA